METRGRRSALTLPFPVHTEVVPQPAQSPADIADPAERVTVAGAYLEYLGRLKRHLESTELDAPTKTNQ